MQKLQQILTTPKDGRLPYLPPLIEIDEMESEGLLYVSGEGQDSDGEQGDEETFPNEAKEATFDFELPEGDFE